MILAMERYYIMTYPFFFCYASHTLPLRETVRHQEHATIHMAVVHVVPLLENTYAAPAFVVPPGSL